jgi:predicted house-cleaning NTP pyrophosphatase (Maf/HAM1 superfamily)
MMGRFILVSDPFYKGALGKAGYDFDYIGTEQKDKELSDAKKTAIFNSFTRSFNASERIGKNLPIISVSSFAGIGTSMIGLTRNPEITKKAIIGMSDAWISMFYSVSGVYKSKYYTECEELEMRMKHIGMENIDDIITTQMLYEKPGSISFDFVREWKGNLEILKGTSKSLIDKVLTRLS